MTTDPIDAALNLLTQQKAQAQEHIQQIQGQVEQAQRDIYAIDFAARVLAALRRDMQSAAPPPEPTPPVIETPALQEYETHADYAAAQMPTVSMLPDIPVAQDGPHPPGIPRSGIVSRRG